MTAARTRRRLIVPGAALGVIALGLSAAPASATVNPDGSTTVDLLSITDFHGALVQAPNIAAQVSQFRADNPDTIFSSVGDSIGGSTFESALQDDVPSIEALNAAGLEVSAVGNHEFDQGYADITGRVSDLADWPYLAANVDGTGSEVGTNLPPYEIITTASGVDVAYIGTVTLETPSIVSPAGIEGVEFSDPVEVTNQIAAELSDGDAANGEADVVVALIHEGGSTVAPGLSADVDVAFAGHSHLPANLTTPSGAPVVQAEASGSLLGHVELTVGTDGEITVVTAENLPVTEYAQPFDENPDAAVYDPEVAAIVREAFVQAEELGQEPVGTVLNAVNGASNDGTPSGDSPPSNRGGESPLGNLLATVALDTANNLGRAADFGIINPGGIRADLDPSGDGTITYAEAFGTSPFGNTIGTIDLTGAQVIELLEQQFIARGDRPMLALGLSPELSYLYDPAAAVGERVTDVFFLGAPIDEAATYRVAANTFLLAGGDDFTVLTEGTNFQETGYIDVEGVIDYLDAHPDIDPATVQQSVGVTHVTDLTQALEPGDSVEVDLSSLSFTTGEPQPATVRVFLDDAEVGTVDVDQTITVGSNETGQASTSFVIPEDVADGVHTVRYEWDVQLSADGPVGGGDNARGLPSDTSTADDASATSRPDDGVLLGTGEAPSRNLLQPLAASTPGTQWVTTDILVEAAAEPSTPPTTEEPTPSETPGATSGGDEDGDSQAGGSGTLPNTGAQLGWLPAVLALIAMLAGAGMLMLRRRKA